MEEELHAKPIAVATPDRGTIAGGAPAHRQRETTTTTTTTMQQPHKKSFPRIHGARPLVASSQRPLARARRALPRLASRRHDNATTEPMTKPELRFRRQ